MKRYLAASVIILSAAAGLQGCSMSEEVRRIEAVQRMNERASAARSADLTGEQLFMRSCNTCHPAGRLGMGPALEKMNEHYPTDEALIAFLRKGKGTMPAQPLASMNEKEMKGLVVFLRGMVTELNEPGK